MSRNARSVLLPTPRQRRDRRGDTHIAMLMRLQTGLEMAILTGNRSLAPDEGLEAVEWIMANAFDSSMGYDCGGGRRIVRKTTP